MRHVIRAAPRLVREYGPREGLTVCWIEARYELRRRGENALMWVVWRLPRKMVMWAYIRVGAHATTGRYGGTVVGELSMMDALKRWDDGR